MEVLVSCWNCRVLEARVFTISANDRPNSVKANRLVAVSVERTQENNLHLHWAPLLFDSPHN